MRGQREEKWKRAKLLKVDKGGGNKMGETEKERK